MKVIAFAVRPDEKSAFQRFQSELEIEVTYVEESLSVQNAHLAEGFDGVSILGNCDGSAQVLSILKNFGVRFLASRSAGYNNIDVAWARENGFVVSNAAYSPNSVAEFAMMLMLMTNRKVVDSMKRNEIRDFTLRGLQGRELRNATVGIIGTGKIGATLAKNLIGFGCKILAYDQYQNKELENIAEYVTLDKLYSESDIISLHIPYTKESHQMISSSVISKMKDGAILINTARGELIDTEALYHGLLQGKLAGAGLDVLEGELGVYHHDIRFQKLHWEEYAKLKQLPNVVVTGHMAFYTDQAVSDMVECSLRSLVSMVKDGRSPWQVS